MFDGFALEHLTVGAVEGVAGAEPVTLRVRRGGDGPPVLLVHGHPRTHVTWHRVAADLAADFTVVCPDLRGYGRSTKPAAAPDHGTYSKRAMAGDLVALMRSLGHDRFAAVGHDRGAYVAQRLALDHPLAVERLVVLDAVPISDALARCDARFAAAWWHWFFLGQTDKPAERVINADPLAWYRPTEAHMGPEAYDDLVSALTDPDTVRAMCEDYRAGLGPDRAADEADRAAGRRIACPVLFGYSTRDDLRELYDDPASIWREWADDVSMVAIESGHHMAEEAPDAVARALRAFLPGRSSGRA
jgi:haloacetate dehalogenase